MGSSRGGHTIGGYPAIHAGNLLDMLKQFAPVGSGLSADKIGNKGINDFAPSGYGLGSTAADISNSSLNTIRNTGFYSGTTLVNTPTPIPTKTATVFLMVLKTDASSIQLVSYPDPTTPTNIHQFIRVYSNNAWGEWSALYNLANTTPVNVNTVLNLNASSSGRLVIPVGTNKY